MKPSALIFSNVTILAMLSASIVISFNLPIWLSQGSGHQKWSGSLLSKSNEFYTNISCNSKAQKFCEGLLTLWKAGVVLLSIDTFSLAGYIITLVLLIKRMNNVLIKKGLILSIAATSSVFQLIGFGFWTVYSKVTFSECRKSFYDSADASICLESGAIFAGLLVLLSAIEMCLLIFTLYIYNEKKSVETRTDTEPEIKELGEVA